MDAHNAVLLEALGSIAEIMPQDFPMQDILVLQRQVILLRKQAAVQETSKVRQPEVRAISNQQVSYLNACEAQLVGALDNFNTYLLGFLASKACQRLRDEEGGPADNQTWDEWLDTLSQKQLAGLKMPLDAVDLLKTSGYANVQRPHSA